MLLRKKDTMMITLMHNKYHFVTNLLTMSIPIQKNFGTSQHPAYLLYVFFITNCCVNYDFPCILLRSIQEVFL